LLSVQHESDDGPVFFQHLSNWHETCLSNCESAEDRSPNRQGEIQVAITFDGVRSIFKGLENGDGAAFFERVRHRRQPLDESLTSSGRSRSLKRAAELNNKKLEIDMFKRSAVFTTMLCAAFLSSPLNVQAQKSEVKNIVLVHGAWADGSGWKGVYNILVKDGFNVSMVQEPETSFKDDVAAVNRILAVQNGPSILVAHSYGGAVITEAGTDPSVVGLVYIAAHMPDSGEKESDDGKRFPSDLAKSGAIKKTSDGFTYIDPAQFHELFAADLPSDQAAFMARSQVLNFADNFSATITKAAWRTKPSWMLVSGSDRTINPDLERWYAKRAHSHTVEVAGASHCVYVSHPKEVAAVIESAARTVSK
jgi:pimeloyl-ACP methyl ester carboxylesterase